MNKYRIVLLILISSSIQLFSVYNDVSNIRQVANPYHVLGLDRNFTPQDLKGAKKRLLMQFHSDRALFNEMDPEEAKRRTQEIIGAFDILNNPALRDDYDRFGHILQATISNRAPNFQGELITTNWGFFKHRFKTTVEDYISSFSFSILGFIGAALGKKIYNRELKSDRLWKKLVKNSHLFGYAVSDKLEQKELDKKLKDLKNKILTTQLSLIKDSLDQAQKDKLQKRLDKYLKELDGVQQEINELAEYFHDDFSDAIKNINK